MTNLIVISIIGLAGGIAIGMQAPLAAMISQRLGIMESVLIVHMGGAIAAGAALILMGGGRLGSWQTVPWYALGAGLLGVVVLGSTVYMVPRIGVAAAITLVITGQLMIGATIDHFGILNVEIRQFSPARLMGLSLVLFGAWWTLRH